MKKINKHIQIIRTNNKILSSMSEGPSKLILKALQTKYSRVEVCVVDTAIDLQKVVNLQPDLCFLGLKQVPLSNTDSSMVWVSDYLDEAGIDYTGSSSEAIALEFSKQKAKNVVHSKGLKTPKYFVGNTIDELHNSGLEFPLFVKPTDMGNKMGIDLNSVVHDVESYSHKVNSLKNELHVDSLVEEYLSGREFSVVVIESIGSRELSAYPIEAIVSKNERGDSILGKNNATEHEEVLPVTDKKIHHSICSLAKNVFIALGARDYGRIDMRLDINGVANFLEANLIPGLQLTNYYPTANNFYRSMDYNASILEIVAVSFDRIKNR